MASGPNYILLMYYQWRPFDISKRYGSLTAGILNKVTQLHVYTIEGMPSYERICADRFR